MQIVIKQAARAAITRGPSGNSFAGNSAGQKGAVLIISLIVLVAMTLSALALIRSVSTTNLVSGNLAFREAAMLSADRATEDAMVSCINNQDYHGIVECDGYRQKREDPDPSPVGEGEGTGDGGSWDHFWERVVAPGNQYKSIGSDAAGNLVYYVIHRLCDKEGKATRFICPESPRGTSTGSKKGGGGPEPSDLQVYYRITSRVLGPRNTVVYTQTVIVR
jgi:Tfp pilus assembly protein PilX